MNTDVKAALRDSIGFGVGFIFLYVAIGIMGFTQGFSWVQVLFGTFFIFSTPLQMLLLQSGLTAGLVLIPLILALNARFLLMSAALMPHFKDLKVRSMIPATILVVPSIFIGALVRFKEKVNNPFLYFVALGTPIYILSILCTAAGFILGAHLKSPVLYAMMDIVLPLQFTALAAKHWPDYVSVGAYWAGFILAPFSLHFFHSYSLLLTPFIVGFFAMLLENAIQKRKTQEAE